MVAVKILYNVERIKSLYKSIIEFKEKEFSLYDQHSNFQTILYTFAHIKRKER